MEGIKSQSMRESFSKRRRTRGMAIIDLALILQLPRAAHSRAMLIEHCVS
jgi:hypothetical protein